MESKSPYNKPAEHYVDFIESVFIRAGMYTINGTLEEAGAFLEGYFSGAARYGRNDGPLREWEYWWGFTKWLGVRVGLVEAPAWRSWSQVFRHLRTLHPVSENSEAEVFAEIRAWYLEFLDSDSAP